MPLSESLEQEATDVWELLGIVTFLDPPRADTAETIRRAREYGVQVKMITGDHRLLAQNMSRAVGLRDRVQLADVIPDVSKNEEFVLKPRSFVSKTRSFAFKTRSFVFNCSSRWMEKPRPTLVPRTAS